MKPDDRIAEEIGTYDAKTRLPELLRQVQLGRRFLITNRGEPVALLVPVQPPRKITAAQAIDSFLAFKAQHPVKKQVRLRDLIEEGRA